MTLAKSGDKATDVGKRAVDYVKQTSTCTFEAVILLEGLMILLINLLSQKMYSRNLNRILTPYSIQKM